MLDQQFADSNEHRVAMAVVSLNKAVAELHSLANIPDARALVLDEAEDIGAAMVSLRALSEQIVNPLMMQAAE